MTARRFDHWVDEQLYGPGGFYRSGGQAGTRRGDFLTSPELGPLFGAVVARFLDDAWDEFGRPQPFVVAEAGAGRGALRSAIESSGARCVPSLDYRCVEIAPEIGGPGSVAELPDRAHVILANELLDNVPARMIERTTTGWADVQVSVDGAAASWSLGGPVDLADLPATWPDPDSVAPGVRLPLLERARSWVLDARGRASLVVLIDYGVASTADLVGREWLRTYRAHRSGTDPLVDPGQWDITIDVAWDQLPRPSTLSRQAEWLERWGIEELVDAGRRTWRDRAHIGDLAALRGRSAVTEAAALTDPRGLGAFWVAEWA